jgi:hypothetical protein
MSPTNSAVDAICPTGIALSFLERLDGSDRRQLTLRFAKTARIARRCAYFPACVSQHSNLAFPLSFLIDGEAVLLS